MKVKGSAAIVLVFVVMLVFNGLVLASPSDVKMRLEGKASTRALGAVPVSSRRTYVLAKDFALAISDSKLMDADIDALSYTIVDLVYLIDALEGQAEAVALQNILKSVVRRTKAGPLVSAEIESVSKSYSLLLTAEEKWYFSVGLTQMNLMIAAWANDSVAVKTRLREMQKLARMAPKGTAPAIVAAINGLSIYLPQATFTKEDFTAVVDDAKIITTQVSG